MPSRVLQAWPSARLNLFAQVPNNLGFVLLEFGEARTVESERLRERENLPLGVAKRRSKTRLEHAFRAAG